MKLHGSLNWQKVDNGMIVKSERERMNIGGRSVIGQAMLYPIEQKDLYLEPWFDLFRGFKKDLLQMKIWVIIGYSFNDSFVKEIFLECMKKNQHKMIVVHPSAELIKEKMFNFDSVETISRRFHEYNVIQSIANSITEQV